MQDTSEESKMYNAFSFIQLHKEVKPVTTIREFKDNEVIEVL